MKNLKSIIIIVIFVLIIGGIVYIVSPKRGYLGNLVLSGYKRSNLNAIRLSISGQNPYKHKGYFTCKDKDKINNFLSYLDKVKVLECKENILYPKSGDEYVVDISAEDDKEIVICASLDIYSEDLQFINVEDKYGVEKTYKILNNKFDTKYIKELK
ncbi:hypothetical protein ACFIJ5_14235 [Haloimpatiens sp. FM7330]|uniref:hypothetical protein n=1 Tax=Haloimpatiens sp. FM7330 TaxID=3298610 RepID=UPI00362C43D1